MMTILLSTCNASATPAQLPSLEQPVLINNTPTNNEATNNTNSNNVPSSDTTSVSIQEEKLDVYLLIQNYCPYCTKASEYLKGLESEYPINIIELNVQNRSNLKLCTELCNKYGINPIGVPILFLCKYWMIGWPINAEVLVKNAVEECSAGIVVDIKASGNVNVDINMAGLGILNIEAREPSKINIIADDKVKTITAEYTR